MTLFAANSGEASSDNDAQEKRNEERNRQPPNKPVKRSRNRIHDQILPMRRQHALRLHLFFEC
jgi:hypothetical protein